MMAVVKARDLVPGMEVWTPDAPARHRGIVISQTPTQNGNSEVSITVDSKFIAAHVLHFITPEDYEFEVV